MDQFDEACFTVYIGIDWADAKHDFCLQVAGGNQREFGVFSSQAAHIDEWVSNLHRRYGGKIAIGLELTKGPLVTHCRSTIFLYCFRLTPQRWRSTVRRLSRAAQKTTPQMPS